MLFPYFFGTRAQSEKSLNTMQKLNCGICIEDIEKFYDCSAHVLDLARRMHEKVLASNLARTWLNQGRIVVINNQVLILSVSACS